MEELNFDYLEAHFKKGHRDAHNVLQWLTRLPNQGGHGIENPIAYEVMVEFAGRIAKGEVFAFMPDGRSELSVAVLKECDLRQKEYDSRIGTSIIQELAGKSILDKEINELSDNLIGLLGLVYWKLAEHDSGKTLKALKKRKSIWTKPIRRIWPERKKK